MVGSNPLQGYTHFSTEKPRASKKKRKKTSTSLAQRDAFGTESCIQRQPRRAALQQWASLGTRVPWRPRPSTCLHAPVRALTGSEQIGRGMGSCMRSNCATGPCSGIQAPAPVGLAEGTWESVSWFSSSCSLCLSSFSGLLTIPYSQDR